MEICTHLCELKYPDRSNFYVFDLNIITKQANTTDKQKNSKKNKNKISKKDEKIHKPTTNFVVKSTKSAVIKKNTLAKF